MLDLRRTFLFTGSILTTLIDRFSSKFVYVLNNFRPIFSQLCIGVHTRKEWFGIEDGQNSTKKNTELACNTISFPGSILSI